MCDGRGFAVTEVHAKERVECREVRKVIGRADLSCGYYVRARVDERRWGARLGRPSRCGTGGDVIGEGQ